VLTPQTLHILRHQEQRNERDFTHVSG